MTSAAKRWRSKSISTRQPRASFTRWNASPPGRGYPTKLRLDNGPEFIALALAEWAERKSITLDFIEPDRPMQNGFIERFNGSFRRGVLDMHVFRNLTEVREQAERWVADYNNDPT
jgi:putative transposase